MQYLKDQPSIELIPGVLELFYLENRGMAFGLLQDQYWLFAMMTVLFLIVMVIVFYKLPKTRRFLPLFAVLTVLTAGAVGNFYDRFLNHYVVDFIYVSLINFPVFNVADIYGTDAAQPQPLPPAPVSCFAGSKISMPQSLCCSEISYPFFFSSSSRISRPTTPRSPVTMRS